MSRRKQLRPFKVQDDDDDDDDSNAKRAKNANNGHLTSSNGPNANEAHSTSKSMFCFSICASNVGYQSIRFCSEKVTCFKIHRMEKIISATEKIGCANDNSQNFLLK